MTTSPPFPLESIELVAAGDGPEGPWKGKYLEPDDLVVDVDAVKACPGTDDCLVEHTVAGPMMPDGTHDVRTEGRLSYATVRGFDKWDLQQCTECGGFSWRHNVIADYL